jgi:hypothetical protein
MKNCSLVVLVTGLLLAGTGQATVLLEDDFEDGVISTSLWTTFASNGSVTEENGYLELFAGPETNPHTGNTGEAWVIAEGADFKNVAAAEVSFEMHWWKNYIMGYNTATLDITDGNNVVTIKTFNTDLANSQSGGGRFTLEFDAASAQLFQDGDAVSDSVSLASLSSYYIRFRAWENQPYGSWMTNDPTWPHVTIMRIYGISSVPEPTALGLLALGGLALICRRRK